MIIRLMMAIMLIASAAAAQDETEEPALPEGIVEMLGQAAQQDLATTEEAGEDFSALTAMTALALKAYPQQADAIAAAAIELAGGDEATSAYINELALSVVPPEPEPEPEPPVEEERTYAWLDPRGWNGDVSIGGNFTTGNTEEQGLIVGLKTKRLFQNQTEHELIIDFNYAQSFGVRTQQRLFASHQLFYRGWERAFLFTFLSYEDDEFDGFEFRSVENLGIGYSLLKGDRFNWDIEGGPGVRQVQVEGEDIEQQILGRASSRFDWQISEDINFNNSSSAIFGESTTVENTAALKINLLNALALGLSYYIQFDDAPPAGAEKIDTISKVTITYSF